MKNIIYTIGTGGRGIKVCERWLYSFENFFEDMGLKPTPKHSLDRFPNNDGNYEKNNCMWANGIQQGRNRSDNVNITIDGKTKCITEWAEISGIPVKLISARLKRGWSEQNSIFKQKTKLKS